METKEVVQKSNMTEYRLNQIKGLLFDSLIEEYRPDDAFSQIKDAIIEEERDYVTVTYANGTVNLFKIRYKPYLDVVQSIPCFLPKSDLPLSSDTNSK